MTKQLLAGESRLAPPGKVTREHRVTPALSPVATRHQRPLCVVCISRSQPHRLTHSGLLWSLAEGLSQEAGSGDTGTATEAMEQKQLVTHASKVGLQSRRPPKHQTVVATVHSVPVLLPTALLALAQK